MKIISGQRQQVVSLHPFNVLIPETAMPSLRMPTFFPAAEACFL
jgi:hypothetical protein